MTTNGWKNQKKTEVMHVSKFTQTGDNSSGRDKM